MKLFGNKSGRHHAANNRRSFKRILPVILAVVLLAGLTIGGTIAFLHAESEAVTNSFKAGGITYTLNLEPNAANAGESYADTDVTMPTELTPRESTDLSVTFTPDKDPSLTGYLFDGWYYDADCTEEYTAVSGNDITVNYGDENDSNDAPNKVEITLYAKWTPITYTVKYDGNNATGGSTADSTHTYDVASNLTANGFTRTGYKFLGWSTDSSATTATYTDQESVTNLADTQDAEVTLYAVWKQMDFTLSFDTQAADVPNPASKTVTYEQAYGELPALTRTGYTFNGWTLEKTGGTTITKDSTVNTAADHTLYAQWTPYTYTVKYENNVNPDDTSVTQPTGSTADSIHTYDVAKKLTTNGFTRTGYTFIGWNTKADGTGKTYSDGESVTNLTAEKNGTVTLYAQWGVKSYVLRYHANGGEGTMADQVIEWDKLTKISENKFVNNTGDYKFAGWSTTPTGEVDYLENQQVVNLLESGTLDLYAVWLLNSYTVTFDYNIGYGTPPTKEVQYGKEYGVLPPYLTTETENLFKGWYTAPTGGTRVYPHDIVNLKEDHTLWAHWDPSPANDIIKDLVVHSSADDNNDGVADEIHLEFVCSSNFEKFNIPLKNLIPGQKYTLTYTASNNASFGDHPVGYKNARYGSYILPTATEDAGNINTAVAKDIIATWDNRIEPDGTNDGSHAAINDSWLNGPWKDRTIPFTATAPTMYWAWEFGLMQDHIRFDYNIYDMSLKPVAPKIEFANKTLLKPPAYNAKIVSWNSGEYNANFVFDGDGGCETIYYPITGLTPGATYTITFDHKYTGNFVNSASYDYGCGIMNAKPADTAMASKMSALGSWASNTFIHTTLNEGTRSVTLTFKATDSTAYWVWNMANVSDSLNGTVDIKVTNLSVKHATNQTITFYSAPSAASTLALRPAEIPQISLNWDGIDDTNMEAWYPVDEQYPVAGDSYEMAFEPATGYIMDNPITVVIDGTSYVVNTDGSTAGALAPAFDSATKVLTIPAELLTEETVTVAITASAVPADIVIVPEPPQSDDPVVEATGFILTKNLPNVTIQPVADFVSGSNYSLVLTPDEGYALPATLKLDICGGVYEVSTTGANAAYSPIWPSFDPDTNTLTIPAVLLCETEQGVTVTISGETIALLPEEEGTGDGVVESDEEVDGE